MSQSTTPTAKPEQNTFKKAAAFTDKEAKKHNRWSLLLFVIIFLLLLVQSFVVAIAQSKANSIGKFGNYQFDTTAKYLRIWGPSGNILHFPLARINLNKHRDLIDFIKKGLEATRPDESLKRQLIEQGKQIENLIKDTATLSQLHRDFQKGYNGLNFRGRALIEQLGHLKDSLIKSQEKYVALQWQIDNLSKGWAALQKTIDSLRRNGSDSTGNNNPIIIVEQAPTSVLYESLARKTLSSAVIIFALVFAARLFRYHRKMSDRYRSRTLAISLFDEFSSDAHKKKFSEEFTFKEALAIASVGSIDFKIPKEPKDDFVDLYKAQTSAADNKKSCSCCCRCCCCEKIQNRQGAKDAGVQATGNAHEVVSGK